jgi:intein-encoded DNA endonuclease-like protein
MKETEVAWAAGFLDGEGNFRYQLRTHKSRTHYVGRLIVQASQVDRRPLDRLACILGGKVYGPYKTKNAKHNEYYYWNSGSYENTLTVIRKVCNYMSEPKRLQAIKSLDFALQHKSIVWPKGRNGGDRI